MEKLGSHTSLESEYDQDLLSITCFSGMCLILNEQGLHWQKAFPKVNCFTMKVISTILLVNLYLCLKIISLNYLAM